MMHSKHFDNLARILGTLQADPKLVEAIADYCGKDNSLFHRHKFMVTVSVWRVCPDQSLITQEGEHSHE